MNTEPESRIRVMEPSLANQIAAGEVVERPASVVKELIENALDAGATRVEIEAKAGGRSYLRLQDNGGGMNQAEAVLAFQRFATSKLHTSDELEHLVTLGFRGEALPSIASVSKLLLLTRQSEAAEGTRVEINYGELVDYSTCGCPVGTSLTVRDLFLNVPARLKYLRAPGTEARHITERVQLYVLAWPEIEWHLLHDDKVKLLHNTGTIEGALSAVLGHQVQQNMLPVAHEAGAFKVQGFISQPSFGRASRAYQFFFVNRRPITNKMLSYAVFDAYQGLIEPGRHPVVVLNLELPPPLVDPNVHPQKHEVRFAHSLQVLEETRRALRQALDAARASTGYRPGQVMISSGPAEAPRQAFSTVSGAGASQPGLKFEYPAEEGVRPNELVRELESQRDQITEQLELTPLGCFNGTYILAARGQDLLLIDQHAAHERILYDQLRKQLEQQAPASQELLTPVSVELQPAAFEALLAQREVLEKLGFAFEPFGKSTLLVSAVPSFLASEDVAELMVEFADEVLESGKLPELEEKLHAALSMMACKAAVKAGEVLTYGEIVALLKDLLHTTSPYTCPHGRPTTIALSLGEVEKLFKRK